MCYNELPSSFYEIFDRSLPRLAPGDALSTQKAIQLLMSKRDEQGNLPPDAKIRVLDIGCGNGSQTIELAKQTDCTILAVDNHQPFLDELCLRAEAEGVAGKIEARLGDMHNLGQEEKEGSFDLIWSEGAFFVMGVRDALKMCHRLLVPHGLLGMTEMVWFKPDPPAPCQQFFDDVYPVLLDVESNLTMMEECGFEVLGHFSLPESAWWNFYDPLEARLESLREKHAADSERLEVIESIQAEIDIYREHSSYYGYEFFLLKRQ